jgi:hypothetical protein
MMTFEATQESYVPRDRDAEAAFRELHEAMLDTQWTWDGSDVAGGRLDQLTLDVVHHVTMALPGLTPVGEAPAVERVLAREAYIAVLRVLMQTSSILESEPEMRDALGRMRDSAREMLDRLSPYVGRSEPALRALLVESASFEDTLDDIDSYTVLGRQPRAC